MATIPQTEMQPSQDWRELLEDLLPRQGTWSEDEYLVLTEQNPQTETITVLRLNGDSYEDAGIYRRGESATSSLLQGFSVAVTAVLDMN